MANIHEALNVGTRFVGRRAGELKFGLNLIKEGILFSRFNPFAATWQQTEYHVLGLGRHVSTTPLNPNISVSDSSISTHYAGISPEQVYPIYCPGENHAIGAAVIDGNPDTPIDIYIP